MPVTWFVFPGRPRAELVLIDPYTFTEWEDAMLAILESLALPEHLRLLIDRRGAARPTSTFVGCMVNFFRAHEARLAGTRAAGTREQYSAGSSPRPPGWPVPHSDVP